MRRRILEFPFSVEKSTLGRDAFGAKRPEADPVPYDPQKPSRTIVLFLLFWNIVYRFVGWNLVDFNSVWSIARWVLNGVLLTSQTTNLQAIFRKPWPGGLRASD